MDYTYDAAGFRSVFERSFTWLAGFERNVRRMPEHLAMIDPMEPRQWTYRELNDETDRLACALQHAGTEAGDLVMYQLYNSPQFAFCYIAPQKLGAVNSPANFNLSAGETARLLERDRPRVYIYDCDVRDMVKRALELSAYRPAAIVAVDYRQQKPVLPEGHVFYEDFVAPFTGKLPERRFTPDMYAEVTRFCTSGTTGTPKGVPCCNANEVLSAHDVIMHFPLNPTDVTMNMTPWFHRGGLHSGGICPTFYAGAACVVLRMFSPKACLEYAERYGVTFLTGAPAALNQLAHRQEKHPLDLTRLKGIVTMGSPLEREDCIRYQRLLTPNIFNGYGTTETFWNSFLRPYDLPDMAGSAGRSCTGDEVRVVRLYEDRNAAPDDTVPQDGRSEGEIIIWSPEKSALSYVQNPELTAEKFLDGWFYTRDVGTWDEKGYVTIRGRKDDMIICMGENIYPAQLEEVINRCPMVGDCMVTGVPDASRGQSVALYAVPADPALTIQELNRWCAVNDDLAGYMCPRYYALVDSLPYNATGKKLHGVLKARAEEDLRSGVLQRP